MIRGCSGILALAALLLARPAHAADATAPRARVVLVRAPSDDALIVQTFVRLRSELTSAGFSVEERSEQTNDERDVGTADASALAVIAVRRASEGGKAEIVVADHATHKTVIRTVDFPRDDASLLAMRVVELLRSSLVEPIALPAPEGVPSPAADPLPAPVAAWTRPRPRWALGLGAALIYAGADVGPAGAPAFSAEYGVVESLRVRLLLTGPAIGGEVVGAEGRATLRQELGLLELGWEPALDVPVRPRVGAGLGVYHFDARGRATPPYVGGGDDAFSALGSLGAGAVMRLGHALRLVLEGRGLFAFPRPVVRFASTDAGVAMRPGFAGSLILEVEVF